MKADLIGDHVIIEDKHSHALFDKGGFGVFDKNRLILSLFEALYLKDKERLEIYHNDKLLDTKSFLKLAKKLEPRFWVKFRVYQDIRSRGYITKTALKFGADFRIYERGDKPGTGHAKWILFCIDEGEGFVWQKFTSMVRVAHSVKKKLLIGILDAENDVSYYEVDWTTP